jgi:hypothetical protein
VRSHLLEAATRIQTQTVQSRRHAKEDEKGTGAPRAPVTNRSASGLKTGDRKKVNVLTNSAAAANERVVSATTRIVVGLATGDPRRTTVCRAEFVADAADGRRL